LRGITMIKLSLTDFMDIASKSGVQKARAVIAIKSRPQKYERATDFYGPLREHIIEIHKKKRSKKALDDVLSRIVDKKKLGNYPLVIDGYKRWWGRKTLQWFEPISKPYSAHQVSININPELGLIINGVPYLIKLYFKKAPLAKDRDGIIVQLMEMTLRSGCENNAIMSVLDTRHSKIVPYEYSSPVNKAMIDAELGYIANLWTAI